jgi:hypothetical protein
VILKLNEKDLKRIDELSSYNSNCYWLPFELDGCNVLHVSADDYTEELQYSIGVKSPIYVPFAYFEPTYNKFELKLESKNEEMIWY